MSKWIQATKTPGCPAKRREIVTETVLVVAAASVAAIFLLAAPAPSVGIAAPSPAASPTVLRGDAVRGADVYEAKCTGCHSLDANRIEPCHRGVYGRKAGSLDDFDYSDALRRAGFVWDKARLDRWLTDPETLVPGQKMGFRLQDPQARADVIAFLMRQSTTSYGEAGRKD